MNVDDGEMLPTDPMQSGTSIMSSHNTGQPEDVSTQDRLHPASPLRDVSSRHVQHQEAVLRDVRIETLQRWLSLGAAILIITTWPLWTPQDQFPRIPLLQSLASLSRTWVAASTWFALLLGLSASVGGLISAHQRRWARGCASGLVIAFFVLVLLDQHRLQPWCVHIGVALLLATFAVPARRRSYLSWYIASIYLYSAIAKFDAQFIHTVGQEFARTALKVVGWRAALADEAALISIASAFPIGELAIGLGLLVRTTRLLAAWASILMHLLVLAILGPWGLNHAWGVSMWNVVFLVQNILLFMPSPPAIGTNALAASNGLDNGPPTSAKTRTGTFALRWSDVVFAMAVVMPAGERSGWVDHWLGWAVYAPHSSRARIEIAAAAVDSLPSVVQPFVLCGVNGQSSAWCEVRIDQWSLATLGVPVSPQQRFHIGVARSLAASIDERDIRIELLSSAQRWTGERQRRQLRGTAELQTAAQAYWWNTVPSFDSSPMTMHD